jgi:hypothetical protein
MAMKITYRVDNKCDNAWILEPVHRGKITSKKVRLQIKVDWTVLPRDFKYIKPHEEHVRVPFLDMRQCSHTEQGICERCVKNTM